MKKFFWAALIVCAAVAPSQAAIDEATVRRAWRDVAAAAQMEELPLSIENDKAANAWVTAGKSVTVTTRLMEILANYDEIFGVLSHEAGHAKLDHYTGRVQNSVAVGIGAYLLSELFDRAIVDAAVGIGANLATAGYSREQEVAADDFATDLAFASGRVPTGLYNSLERLVIEGGGTEPSGFNSHPPDERRLARIERRIHEHDSSIKIVKLLDMTPLSDNYVGDEGTPAAPDADDLAHQSERDREIEKWRRELNMDKKAR